MHIEFDPVKNEQNIRLRGLSFERAAAFDFDTAIVAQDVRKNYPKRAMWPSASWLLACMCCASPRQRWYSCHQFS
jgi:uncharacterized DUF497 family protein